MGPVKSQVRVVQRRIREIEEIIQQEQEQLKQYWRQLNKIYPPAHPYDRKNKKEKLSYYLYWDKVDRLKENIDRTEDTITWWKFTKNKLYGRTSMIACAA